jgi:hypothetical protein
VADILPVNLPQPEVAPIPNIIIPRSEFDNHTRFFTLIPPVSGTAPEIHSSSIVSLNAMTSFRSLRNLEIDENTTPPTELIIYMSEGRVKMVIEVARVRPQ